MLMFVFDTEWIKSQNGFVMVPGPVKKLGPIQFMTTFKELNDDWAIDVFSGSILHIENRWIIYATFKE